MTCHGAGNGKPGGARRVQFAMGLFGKTQEKPPKELVNEWSLKIRKEMRVVDRQIRGKLLFYVSYPVAVFCISS